MLVQVAAALADCTHCTATHIRHSAHFVNLILIHSELLMNNVKLIPPSSACWT